MFIIKTKDNKYWTDAYTELEGFVYFTTKSKEGKTFKHEINKNSVTEIVNLSETDGEEEQQT